MAKKDKKEVKNIKDKTSFMKSFKAELKKVSWPTPKQLFNNTVAVLTIVIITAVIVFALDFVFESMNKYGIDKVKNVVSNSSINDTIDSEDEMDNEETLEEDIVEDENIENEIEENIAE